MTAGSEPTLAFSRAVLVTGCGWPCSHNPSPPIICEGSTVKASHHHCLNPFLCFHLCLLPGVAAPLPLFRLNRYLNLPLQASRKKEGNTTSIWPRICLAQACMCTVLRSQAFPGRTCIMQWDESGRKSSNMQLKVCSELSLGQVLLSSKHEWQEVKQHVEGSEFSPAKNPWNLSYSCRSMLYTFCISTAPGKFCSRVLHIDFPNLKVNNRHAGNQNIQHMS